MTYLAHGTAEDTVKLLLEGINTDAAFNLVDDAAKLAEESTTLLDCSSTG